MCKHSKVDSIVVTFMAVMGIMMSVSGERHDLLFEEAECRDSFVRILK